MPFKNKTAWSTDMKNVLLHIKHQAILTKQDGDKHPLLDIIFSSWKDQYPQSKATKGSLKVCLSRLSKVDTHPQQQSIPITTSTPSTSRAVTDNTPYYSDIVQVGTPHTHKTPRKQLFTSASTHKLDTPPDRNISHTSSSDNTTNSIRSNRKVAAKSPMSDTDLIDTIIDCYKTIRAKRNNSRQSPYDIRKQLKEAWQQQHPQSSISLRTIDKIIKTHTHHTTMLQSTCTFDSSHSSDKSQNHDNVPDNPVNLLHMHTASVHLGSEPIFTVVCYNCGCLLTDDAKRSKVIAFNPDIFNTTQKLWCLTMVNGYLSFR